MTQHYENFPVASILLPRHLRHPVGIIYTFARQADDFADEGDLDDATRLALLEDFRAELMRIAAREQPESELFRQLAEIIEQYHLPVQLFHDLLDAFSQDVCKKRYAHFGEVMDYCRRSANPVGRLLLHLYGATDSRNLAYSDAICSSLQLINFLQDVAIDYRKDRIYLPQDEMQKHRISEDQIARGDSGGAWGMFMLFQIERARKMLQAGAPLGRILPGRIGLEMRMIIMGGESILRKLHKSRGDVFSQRPVLKAGDWAYMFYRSIRAK
jgi:squalene synthase HpnC